jgi:hypothetical protein
VYSCHYEAYDARRERQASRQTTAADKLLVTAKNNALADIDKFSNAPESPSGSDTDEDEELVVSASPLLLVPLPPAASSGAATFCFAQCRMLDYINIVDIYIHDTMQL